jgi:hypothetical protein
LTNLIKKKSDADMLSQTALMSQKIASEKEIDPLMYGSINAV